MISVEHPLAADLRRCPRLAVYGTLMHGERNHEEYLGSLPPVASGTVLGQLVEVPAATPDDYSYPALLAGVGRVAVDIVELTTPETLAAIDELEFDIDVDLNHDRGLGAAEYERVITMVRTADATGVEAWCYRYRREVDPGWRRIPSGDWRLRDR